MSEVAERVAWVALAAVEGVGDVTFGGLVGELGGAATVLAVASRGRLVEVRKLFQGLTGMRIALPVVEGIRAAAADPGAVERRAAELGVWTVTPLDPSYPARLRELDPAPAVLWGTGSLDAVLAERSVAVVGTRRPTLHGRALAARVATRLVECGCVVVSGLAIGIDGAAQAATVEAGGRTVAVLGAGHSRPGPRAHRWLVERILASGGGLISELAPDVGPTRGTFPRRNRIISILSSATVIIEAPARSGALITARLALEQGRSVLAAPGRPFDPATAGCLALLRDTPARPLVGLDEMVVDLGLDIEPDAIGPEGPGSHGRLGSGQLGAEAALRLLGGPERAVAERLRRGPASADALIDDTGLPPAVASGAITLLLLRGWAQQVGVAYLPAGPLLRLPGGGVT